MSSFARSLRQAAGRAFTMVEMLVALALTTIMILFLSSIMGTVSEGVSTGLATSRVLQASRVFVDQLTRDVESMVGPDGGGFIVIHTARITNVRLHSQDPKAYDVNADQIAFVRTRGELEPIAPDNVNSVSNSSTAPFVRVWYGHCRRTNADGTGGAALGTGSNQYLHQWILGHQALFLDPSPSGNKADSAREDATVSGANTSYYGGIAAGARKLYQGLTDVADQTLGEINADIAAAGSPNDQVKLYSFGNTASNRLRVNPARSTEFEPYRLAQAHPYFIAGVGEFTIEHTVDADSNGDLDVDGGNAIVWQRPAAPGAISWRAGQEWPHLIRLTFRVHDRRGKLTGSDGGPGKVFQQLIRVRR